MLVVSLIGGKTMVCVFVNTRSVVIYAGAFPPVQTLDSGAFACLKAVEIRTGLDWLEMYDASRRLMSGHIAGNRTQGESWHL